MPCAEDYRFGFQSITSMVRAVLIKTEKARPAIFIAGTGLKSFSSLRCHPAWR